MMELGMPTLIEAADIEACARLCSELGLKFVELNMNMPQYQLDTMDTGRLLSLAEQYGIYYTIHLDENLNVSDFNPYIAQGYRQTVMETIELAKAIHVPVLNMHLARGVYFTLPEQRVYLFDAYQERYLADMRAFRDACAQAIGDSGIIICIENCDGFLPFQEKAIGLLLESPVFALTYDVGHDHGCGGLDKALILKNRDRLAHMHLHDAQGKRNHLALGDGEMDIDACLQLAWEHRCRVVLETKTIEGLCKSVKWIRDWQGRKL